MAGFPIVGKNSVLYSLLRQSVDWVYGDVHLPSPRNRCVMFVRALTYTANSILSAAATAASTSSLIGQFLCALVGDAESRR